MAGNVCTIAGGKGGVGKTTTAVNIAAILEEHGYDTVVVDADLGMANLGEMLGVDHEQSVHEILAGNSTVSEALTDAQGGMTVVPGEQSLEAFAEADPAKLRKVIRTLRNPYDVVLVDTGAGLSHETTVPLGIADGILLCTTPDTVAVGDTVKTAELAHRVDGSIIGGMVTRVTRNTDVEDIAAEFDFPLLGVIPVDVQATEEEPLVINTPDSQAAEAYRQLTDSLERVFFEGVSGEDLEQVFDRRWFLDEDEIAELDLANEDEADGDVDDDGGEDTSGMFGVFRTG
jgi:septum site-determining protein MinD